MEPSPNRERRIRILPDRLANLIAAGEVVERPSAVVKELVENAIDAGATTVTVELEAGGRRLIQVSDDGCGMNADDAVLAIERHATSKIADPRDLDAIASYGFRGEALPSIAAVSRLRLQTCDNADGIGIEVIIEGGELRSVKEVGRARGTTVTVRNLFYNTPARRKFLRTDQTELRHCTREITGLALGAPEVGITVTHSGRTLFECHPIRSWQDRARDLFGREIIERGVEFAQSNEIGRVYGLLGRPGDAGGGYREQYLLVNGRLIQAKTLRKAILDGYENTLESGAQPFFLVFVDIDPAVVDVNVHPQKREVRFRDERAVYTFVRTAIADAFSGRDDGHRRSDVPDDDHGEHDEPPGVAHFWREARNTFVDRPSRVSDIARTGSPTPSKVNTPTHWKPKPSGDRQFFAEPPRAATKKSRDDAQTSLGLSKTSDSPSEKDDREEIAFDRDSKLWQFRDKYIFVSTPDGLWIVDQHVAHERILYEEALAAFDGDQAAAQRLLFPVTVELTPEQDAVFDDVQPLLTQMGFDLERLSGRSVMVSAYPGSAENWSDGGLLRELIDEVAEPGFKRTDSRDRVATAYSCKAAIKAGEPLSAVKMRWLLDRLFTTSMPYVCPHGRPIIVKIDMNEFDRRFGRS